MPDENYHIEKKERFRDTAHFLAQQNFLFSHDSAVQDCFYSSIHETERFLSRLNRHSRSHRQRENYMTNYMVSARGRVTSRDFFRRNPRNPSDRLFDRNSEFFYMLLSALRLDFVYGEEILGRLRHATDRDVVRARHILNRFFNALNRHETNLRRRGII